MSISIYIINLVQNLNKWQIRAFLTKSQWTF